LHLGGELFKSVTGVQLISVPYKGEQLMITDMLGGQLEIAIVSSQAAGTLLKSGRVKVLATMAGTRSNALPDVPTVSESGYPGFHVNTWAGLFVTSATPSTVVEKIHAAAAAAVKARTLRKRCILMGLPPWATARRNSGN